MGIRGKRAPLLPAPLRVDADGSPASRPGSSQNTPVSLSKARPGAHSPAPECRGRGAGVAGKTNIGIRERVTRIPRSIRRGLGKRRLRGVLLCPASVRYSGVGPGHFERWQSRRRRPRGRLARRHAPGIGGRYVRLQDHHTVRARHRLPLGQGAARAAPAGLTWVNPFTDRLRKVNLQIIVAARRSRGRRQSAAGDRTRAACPHGTGQPACWLPPDGAAQHGTQGAGSCLTDDTVRSRPRISGGEAGRRLAARGRH